MTNPLPRTVKRPKPKPIYERYNRQLHTIEGDPFAHVERPDAAALMAFCVTLIVTLSALSALTAAAAWAWRLYA